MRIMWVDRCHICGGVGVHSGLYVSILGCNATPTFRCKMCKKEWTDSFDGRYEWANYMWKDRDGKGEVHTMTPVFCLGVFVEMRLL